MASKIIPIDVHGPQSQLEKIEAKIDSLERKPGADKMATSVEYCGLQSRRWYWHSRCESDARIRLKCDERSSDWEKRKAQAAAQYIADELPKLRAQLNKQRGARSRLASI